jgi:putative acetyltransferase
MNVQIDDPARPDVLALLEEHLRNMHELSPPESVHALDVSGLRQPDVTFWTVRDGRGVLLGCGALKELDPVHGEVKSMRTPQSARRQGAGRAVLAHIIEVARARGYQRLSLETGSIDAFAPAWRLYESFGFGYCGPFAEYVPDPNSVFMTLAL